MDQSAKKSFNFVNLSHPGELKDEQTKLRIRHLAMTEVGKLRRKPKTRRARNEMVLQLREPTSTGPTNTLVLERFGAGGVDPFGPFPIEMNDVSRALIANIFRNNSNHQKLLRGSWYPIGISDAAVFHSVLANSQLYIDMCRKGALVCKDSPESLMHHHKTISLVQKMVNDPRKHRSDVLLGGIGALMCHDFIIGANETYTKHKEALVKTLELRGGIDTITKENMRITLTWADLAGSFQMDTPPVFPMPDKWLEDSWFHPSLPRPYSPISLTWKQEMPMQIDWISIFDDIFQRTYLEQALSDDQRESAVTTGCWMEPILIRLLSIRPLYKGSTPENITEEVCRLGTLLFLCPLWREMGANPVRGGVFLEKLLWLFNHYMIDWGELKPLLIWTVYFAAIEAPGAFEKDQFVFMLAMLMNGMQIKEWDDLIQLLKGVLWVENIFAGGDSTVRDGVMAIVSVASMGEDGA